VVAAAIAVVALLIGTFATLYLTKRRARNLARTHPFEDPLNLHEASQLADIASAGGARPNPTATPPLPDDDFARELLSSLQELGSKIQEHVESNYTLDEIQDQGTLTKAIASLPFLKHDAQFLAHLCVLPSTRHTALRHLIAVTLFSAIDFSTFHKHALLPPAVLAFWESFPPFRGDERRTEGSPLLTPTDYYMSTAVS
jgi:hypothetical protein